VKVETYETLYPAPTDCGVRLDDFAAVAKLMSWKVYSLAEGFRGVIDEPRALFTRVLSGSPDDYGRPRWDVVVPYRTVIATYRKAVGELLAAEKVRLCVCGCKMPVFGKGATLARGCIGPDSSLPNDRLNLTCGASETPQNGKSVPSYGFPRIDTKNSPDLLENSEPKMTLPSLLEAGPLEGARQVRQARRLATQRAGYRRRKAGTGDSGNLQCRKDVAGAAISGHGSSA
jgi:hypothetical protein